MRLRLRGRWLGAPGIHPAAEEALLVIALHGRRHRFAANRAPSPPPGVWQAEFAIPSWALPTRRGQAAVWVGDAVIAVDPPGTVPESRVPARPVVAGAPEALPASAAVAPGAVAVAAEEGGLPEVVDPDREGPPGDMLLKETVTALRAELERRSGEVAQLRGALADARSELRADAARRAGLEATQGELRNELEQLMTAVPRQRREFDEQLAGAREALAFARQELVHTREELVTAHIARDAAVSEAGGLRAELERLSAEGAVLREQAAAHDGDLGEAQRLLAEARALAGQLRGESP